MLLWSTNSEIELISIQRDNFLVLAGNLTGNIWNGQIYTGKHSEETFNVMNTSTLITGVKHGVWHSGKIFLGTDEGQLILYNQDLVLLNSSLVHQDGINCISKKGKSIISADRYQ
jgi:hypothetical protein